MRSHVITYVYAHTYSPNNHFILHAGALGFYIQNTYILYIHTHHNSDFFNSRIFFLTMKAHVYSPCETPISDPESPENTRTYWKGFGELNPWALGRVIGFCSPPSPHATFFKCSTSLWLQIRATWLLKTEPLGCLVFPRQGFQRLVTFLSLRVSQILLGRETSGILSHLSEQKHGPHSEGGYVVSPAHHVLNNCLGYIILVNLKRKQYEHALPEAVKEFPPRNNAACLLLL